MSERIYIDPGHSEKDPGAVGYEVERDLNEKVSKYMNEHLQENYICETKVDPITTDSVSDVADNANAWKATLLVSNHFNAGGGDGYEALVYSSKTKDLGQIFEKHVKAAGQNSRGVKYRPDLGVLRLSTMPAILNEGAFVDNKKDITDWNEDHELKQMGIAYAEAAAEYRNLVKRVSVPAAPNEEAGKCYASKVVAIMLSEVGYIEKKTNSQLDSKTANAGYNNYTKYARDLDALGYFYNTPKQGYAYCDVTVDWAFVQAFGVEKAMQLLCQPKKSAGAGCQQSAMYYQKKGRLFKKNPKVGDQIFFWNAAKTSRGHTGLVVKVDATTVYTVEGNTSSTSGVVANGGGVWAKSYPLNHPRIADYGRPAYDEEPTTGTGGMPELEAESKNTYKVKAGDSLWKIAAEKLGDGRRNKEIMELNGLKSTVIRAGMVLKLPVDEAPAPSIKKGDTVKLKSGAKTYDGKTLWSGVYKRKHKVKDVKGDRAVITYAGITVAAVHVTDLVLA